VWRDTSTGEVDLWNSVAGAGPVSFTGQDVGVVPLVWQLEASGDFTGSGPDQLLWRNTSTGDVFLWNTTPSAGTVSITGQDLGAVSTSWQIQGVGDFNDDGKTDILWRNTSTGDVGLWDSVPGAGSFNVTFLDFGAVASVWQIQGVGDFTGDGKADVLWRNTSTGDVFVWNFGAGAGSNITGQDLGALPLNWNVQEVGDFNGDGKADILWRDTAGDTVLWTNVTSPGGLDTFSGHDFGVVATSWHVQSDWLGT
jgi:hypothetical protein